MRFWLLLVLILAGCGKPPLHRVGSWSAGARVTALRFSPTGDKFVVASEAGLVELRGGDGKPLSSPPARKGRVEALCFDGAGGRLAWCTAIEPTVEIWDVGRAATVARVQAGSAPVAARKIRHHAVEWEDPRTGQVLGSVSYVGGREGGHINFLGFVGEQLLSNDARGQLSCWNAAGAQTWVTAGRQRFAQMWTNPDGTRLAATGLDRAVLFVLETTTGKVLWSKAGLSNINDAVFSPDSSRLAVAATGRVHLLGAVNGESQGELATPARRVHFSPDGGRLLTVGTRTILWSAQSLQQESAWGEFGVAAFLGNDLVVGTETSQARLLDLKGKEKAIVPGHFSILAVRGDGKAVALAGEDKLELWRVER